MVQLLFPVVTAAFRASALGQEYVGSRESKFEDWIKTSILDDLGKRPLSNPLATWEVIWLLVTPDDGREGM